MSIRLPFVHKLFFLSNLLQEPYVDFFQNLSGIFRERPSCSFVILVWNRQQIWQPDAIFNFTFYRVSSNTTVRFCFKTSLNCSPSILVMHLVFWFLSTIKQMQRNNHLYIPVTLCFTLVTVLLVNRLPDHKMDFSWDVVPVAYLRTCHFDFRLSTNMAACCNL